MFSTPFTSSLSIDTYPEKGEQSNNRFDDYVAYLLGRYQILQGTRKTRFNQFYQEFKPRLKFIRGMNETEFKDYATQLRYAMVRDGLEDKHIIDSFALTYYTIVKKLKMRPYKVQLMAAWTMMQGSIAEMETGEGKTLSATFPACTAAMARIPVHIITANDYLAQRDARLMEPVYKALGLSVGVISSESTLEERRHAYACNITYCTSKQVALDYLRDRRQDGLQHKALRHQLDSQLNQHISTDHVPLLRGLCFAIIDEADSVLIDDARVPLILAKDQMTHPELTDYYQSLAIANLLKENNEFILSLNEPRITLTELGLQRIREIVNTLNLKWSEPQSQQNITLALRAMFILQAGRDYLVKDNQIELIDENTGRRVQDRNWQKGLQQMVECKEGCALSSEKTILARISFQRFFNRYLHLAGMTGTAREVAGELKQIYQLDVFVVPTRKPSRRKILPQRIYSSMEIKWHVCVKRIEKIHKKGRPILVGTRSVSESEYLGLLLDKAGLAHQILNARQDEDEARIISKAGKTGQITISTNMAGRGTDIRLLKEARQAGGLHVIAVELNDAHRIDRQLYGRTARQGNRGSCEAILSLDDRIFKTIPVSLRTRLSAMLKPHRHLPIWLGRLLIFWAQTIKQAEQSRIRYRLLKWDYQQDKTLAFNGRRE
ncbi:MAG: prepilin peptidase [Gammaproteobacteria bacterium]|nr:prepilin peptidase [Gammaproteobacteria bacterium]